MAVAIVSLLTPLLAFAQDAAGGMGGHKLEDLIFGLLPFLILGVLFWFFFLRQIRNQKNSPLVKRNHNYLDRHEQHMQRMEQLVDRIAVALEKDKNKDKS